MARQMVTESLTKESAKPSEDRSDDDIDMQSDDEPSTAKLSQYGIDQDSDDDTSDGLDEDAEHEAEGADAIEPGATSFRKQMQNISFGALAAAQDSIATAKKNGIPARDGRDSQKLGALRERLAELREAKGGKSSKQKKTDSTARTSKHAPTEQSSKHQVTRRREVISTAAKAKSRDPRFSAVSGPINEDKIKKHYAFLKDYQADELNELKGAFKKAKTEDDKAKLRREIVARENRQKAEREKERHQSVVREHRKREKDLIAQGKRPYYLKKSEQKKQAVALRFAGMKAKEKDKAIKKQRKRQSEKERRAMPADRRRRDDV